MKIRKGDKVKVTTGKNRGTIGTVLVVNPKKNSVVVDGVNVKKRAIKKSETNNESYIYLQHPVNASNVRLVDDNGVYLKSRTEIKTAEVVKAPVKKAKAVKGETKSKSKTK
jgi:large subunit ribosomal protein L24